MTGWTLLSLNLPVSVGSPLEREDNVLRSEDVLLRSTVSLAAREALELEVLHLGVGCPGALRLDLGHWQRTLGLRVQSLSSQVGSEQHEAVFVRAAAVLATGAVLGFTLAVDDHDARSDALDRPVTGRLQADAFLNVALELAVAGGGIVAVVPRGHEASEGASCGDRIGDAAAKALVRLPVGSEGHAGSLVYGAVQARELSLLDIRHEDSVQVHVPDGVQVDADRPGPDEARVLDVHVAGAGNVEEPGESTVDN